MSQAKDIHHDIERTRSEIADTLQAIERRFSPDRFVDKAMESMRMVHFNESRVMDMARDNPVPLALVGLGISWLVLASLRSSSPAESDVGYGEGGEMAGDIRRAAQEWAGYGAGAGNGSSGLSNVAETARERAGEIAGNLRESAQDLTGRAQSRMQQVSQRMQRMTHSMRDQAGDLYGRTSHTFEEHPLLIGLAAMAAGVALGAALPRTRREVQVYAGAGGNLVESARTTSRQALRTAGRVVQRAAQAVTEGGEAALQKTKEAVKEETRGGQGGSATAH